MIQEIEKTVLASLRQAPITIDSWTSTPAPDIRVDRWQLYRETEVNQVIEIIEQGRNVVVSGCEQAGKSTLMVETYYALTASQIPVFGFSTRAILEELPQSGGKNLNMIRARLNQLPARQIIMIDNADYLFRAYPTMVVHDYAGRYYQDPNGYLLFTENCHQLLNLLAEKNFRLIFSLHNDWPDPWFDQELKSSWEKLLGVDFEVINLNPCLEPERAEVYLRLERGISIKGVEQSLFINIIGSISFTDLKRKSSEELHELFKPSLPVFSQTTY